jgi:hypothetical protein
MGESTTDPLGGGFVNYPLVGGVDAGDGVDNVGFVGANCEARLSIGK